MFNYLEVKRLVQELNSKYDNRQIACIISQSHKILFKDKLEILKELQANSKSQENKEIIKEFIDMQIEKFKVLQNYAHKESLIYEILSDDVPGVAYLPLYEEAINYANLYFIPSCCNYSISLKRIYNNTNLNISNKNLEEDNVNSEIAKATFNCNGELINVEADITNYFNDNIIKTKKELSENDVIKFRESHKLPIYKYFSGNENSIKNNEIKDADSILENLFK